MPKTRQLQKSPKQNKNLRNPSSYPKTMNNTIHSKHIFYSSYSTQACSGQEILTKTLLIKGHYWQVC
jgi:hypothetical protein